MNRFILSLFFILSFFSRTLWSEEIPSVLVSVAPHKFFVEAIAGDKLNVILMVPAGASAHTFEPSPKQMMTASQAAIWFRIGEPFETRAINALKSHKPSMEIVDLRQGVDLIWDVGHHHACKHCQAAGMDLHFWLSARQAQIQAKTIADTLIAKYPEHKQVFEENLQKFTEVLKNLDAEIQEILAPLQNRNILVSHPAYAYFVRDYNLHQYSIEYEGKDPSPQQLNKTLELARNLHIKTIYIQPQYNNKGANLIAEYIGAKVVSLDPYSENYIATMRQIAQTFAKG